MRTPKARALGSAMRKAREERGLTLRAFAAQLGRDPGVLSRWENGERTPRVDQVAQILTLLGYRGQVKQLFDSASEYHFQLHTHHRQDAYTASRL